MLEPNQNVEKTVHLKLTEILHDRIFLMLFILKGGIEHLDIKNATFTQKATAYK